MTDGASSIPASDGLAPSAAVAGLLLQRFGSDASLLAAEMHVDERGTLTAFDPAHMPFVVQRVFAVTGVLAGTTRGGHRHRRGDQALFCLRGCVEIELRRGESRLELELTPNAVGLRIAAGVWSAQRYVADGSELLVMASEAYDPEIYDDAW